MRFGVSCNSATKLKAAAVFPATTPTRPSWARTCSACPHDDKGRALSLVSVLDSQFTGTRVYSSNAYPPRRRFSFKKLQSTKCQASPSPRCRQLRRSTRPPCPTLAKSSLASTRTQLATQTLTRSSVCSTTTAYSSSRGSRESSRRASSS